jgi:hypothetical protein
MTQVTRTLETKVYQSEDAEYGVIVGTTTLTHDVSGEVMTVVVFDDHENGRYWIQLTDRKGHQSEERQIKNSQDFENWIFRLTQSMEKRATEVA